MKLYAFYINSSACSGCKTCQVACKDKNDLKPGVNWRRVYDIQGGKWKSENEAFVSVPFAYNLSLSCFNCETPKCVNACPTRAIYENENGLIVIDHDLCMGCRYCEWVCPYGAPQYDPELKMMTKCNFCEDYITTGQKPSCVDACPMRALDFGAYDEMTKKYGTVAQVFPLPHQDLTGPGMIIKPHKDAVKANSESAEVNVREDL
jgi:anaerobic dimethyl sulfoxide reductase subunit B (iron-sulfur subunit)